MIYILSNQDDDTTNTVMDWIHFLGQSAIRINCEDFFNDFHLKISNSSINFRSLTLSNFTKGENVVWLRKWNPTYVTKIIIEVDNSITNQIGENLHNELNSLSDFFIAYLKKQAKVIGCPSKESANKLIQLICAKDVGFKIPNTIISSNFKKNSPFKHNENLITKAISNNLIIDSKDEFLMTYANSIKSKEIKGYKGFPSLFQALIPKDYEIRTFFFGSKIYSMAIFSQLNEKTKIDFRRYDNNKPNRTIPYKLPSTVEEKILKFAQKLDIYTGSIDLIRFKNDYYFLEVNPLGQFGMVSYPCNYTIEKEIAEELISIHNG
ncbi:MAG: grasp-with-spasm system ATP-grasp peptide maturase [Bacteroidales bacterium]|nr:grasp-with-spasm system ATP-grasp peptide maturase [Bacteroidales bacterium]MBN2749199.1 grasp-with-spasm system ATP-grasp peptide maturase [Bacteroidales bacterium]